MKNTEAHFWAKVKKTAGCWLYGGQRVNGYGRIGWNGGYVFAHVLSYRLLVGEISQGLCVLHRCDIRNCVNPAHLWLGTHAENYVDMVAKGRDRKAAGGTHYKAKLNELTAGWAKELYAKGFSPAKIGCALGVSRRAIRNVLSGVTWSSLRV